MKKAQTMSMDAIIGVLIFLIVGTLILYIIGNLSDSNKFESLADEGELISEGIENSDSSNIGFIEGSKVNEKKLDSFTSYSYEELKGIFGLNADFCIHLEDSEGNLIPIYGNVTGIGSSKAKISGNACTEIVK